MRKRLLTLGLAAVMALSLTACGGESKKSTTEAKKTTEKTTAKKTTAKKVTTEATTAAKSKKKKSKGKDITKYDIIFKDEYRNDSTGKWRLAETADNFDIEKYAVSYYDNYFKSDDEIHVFVNFTRKTTTRIADMGGILDVSIHEYVKGEEHDANEALGGMLLNEYHVDRKTGKIEKIQ